MFNSSPIESWEGVGAFFTFFDGGALFWFWVAVICLIIPIWIALRAASRRSGLSQPNRPSVADGLYRARQGWRFRSSGAGSKEPAFARFSSRFPAPGRVTPDAAQGR